MVNPDQEQERAPRRGLRHWFPVSSKILSALIGLMLLGPILFGVYAVGYSLYSAVDRTTFPYISEPVRSGLAATTLESPEPEKGALLLTSIHARLGQELESSFGWSVNDIFFMPTAWMDNRANRQRGVIFATRMLVNFFSTNMAKLGPADPENPQIKQVREKHIVYGEEIWGLFRASSEREYRRSIELLNAYKQGLLAGKATYNLRTDDIYNVLDFVTSETFLGQVLGQLIQANEAVAFSDLDDRIYYSQGVVLVVRDFLNTLIALYPSITEKGGQENVAIALRDMDKICTFDPLVVLRGRHDSMLADHRGKLARYLITVVKRMEDVAESIRR